MFVSNFLCHVPNHLVFTAMYDLGARFRLCGTMDAVRFWFNLQRVRGSAWFRFPLRIVFRQLVVNDSAPFALLKYEVA